MTGSKTVKPIPAGDAGTPELPDFGQAALELLEAGFQPIPIRPGTKIPAVKWKNGQFEMTARNIRRYWRKHPDHELAVILGPDTIVFDADTPEGVIALYMLWESLDIQPNVIVETDRGEHHYFRLAKDTFAKSDAPAKDEHPERVDIKTGNAIAVVPPSTGKQYLVNEALSVEDLVEIGQAGVDTVYRHNGRDAPRKPQGIIETGPPPPQEEPQLTSDTLALLQHIDPNCGYDDWLRVGMAIHHEFRGSDMGFDIYDTWSSRGETYPGQKALYTKWLSFRGHTGTPVTLGTLHKLATDNGADPSILDENFTALEPLEASPVEHGLTPYSLRGMSGQFEAEMLEHKFVLGRLAILGQWTVIYAPPNSGKTLLVLWLIIRGIEDLDINPEDLFYINADDNHTGLTGKLKLAEEHGFHMLSPGYRKFKAKNLLALLQKLCTSNQARGTIVILDTLKKFTDPMDKRTAADFGSTIREFISKGGTLIALAHVNKKKSPEGKPVYQGTTDIVDDADCAFVIDVISDEGDVRTVEFENIKSRGMVAKRAAYSYSTAEELPYADILASVTPVKNTVAEQLRITAEAFNERDAELIEAISATIREGVTGKTGLIRRAKALCGASRAQVEQVIEKFTGEDPERHHWNYTRGAKGLTNYALLPEPPDIEDIEDVEPLFPSPMTGLDTAADGAVGDEGVDQ